jgi:hypothetical protein
MKESRTSPLSHSLSSASTIRKHTSIPPNLLSVQSDADSFLSSTLSSRKFSSAKRQDITQITNIIDKTVKNLKYKFTELKSLRNNFPGASSGHANICKLEQNVKNKLKSSANFKRQKATALIQGLVIPVDEPKRAEKKEKKDNYYKDDWKSDELEEDYSKQMCFNPNFEKALFDDDISSCGESSQKNKLKTFEEDEIEELKMKLESYEKNLRENERTKFFLEDIIEKKQKEIKFLQENCGELNQTIKLLRIELSDLRSKMRNSDQNEASNENAIRNLSFIILSKDSTVKQNAARNEAKNMISKYLEILNELYTSNQVLLDIADKIKRNQHREAWKYIIDMQEPACKLQEKTKKDIEKLEVLLFQNKPYLPETDPLSLLPSKDLIIFLQAQALLLEELLIP